VVIVCPNYEPKEWCGLEWKAIFDLLKQRKDEDVMLCRFNHATVKGLHSIAGFVELDGKTAEQAATLILERLALNEGKPKNHYLSSTAPASQASVAPNAFAADISRIIKYAPEQLIGREDELKILSDAWEKAVLGEKKRPHVLTFVALGGEGKTSLVAKWAAELASQKWPGCDAAFAWSFYSQGTKEQSVASSDLFLREALTFFGDSAMANSPSMVVDKGKRLAELVGERRALLILDGLEPLQYPPTSPLKGELKDQGITALLKGLAANSHGLCVITTRYSVQDLTNFWQTTAPEIPLLRLSKQAGVALLQKLGVRKESGSQAEFEKLVEDVKGHALTLNLLGTYLHDAHAGDMRKRDLVKIEEANAEEQSGHAFHVMDAYVKWFESEGEKGKRAIAVLRLLGLFDRPASADCIAALKQPPVMPELTEALVGMNESQRNIAFTRLEEAKLLTVNRDAAGTLLSLDAHPLIREYFATRLRDQLPEAWRAAHRRLYEHLCATTPDKPQPTLEDLQPLYQAVAHGCQAGMQMKACDMVYLARIQRGEEAYSTFKLGALGSDLGAIACFFEQTWSLVSPALKEDAQSWLLNEAAFSLRALGRLTEALEAMRAGLKNYLRQKCGEHTARLLINLSELRLMLGDVAGAVEDAKQSVTYADGRVDAFTQMASRTIYADALHSAGRRNEADGGFRKAEKMQIERQPNYPLLYSLWGFRYCELLLAAPERGAWQTLLGLNTEHLEPETLTAFSQRAVRTLQWAEQNNVAILDIACDHLSLGRVALYKAILENSSCKPCHAYIQHAVDGLRRAGQQQELPRGLLTRAWCSFAEASEHKLHGRAQEVTECLARSQTDLDEAWEIAERGPMKLHLADIHLHRARLFFREAKYPWESPAADLAAAEKLINECGYHRRDQELADAKKAILGKY